MANHIDNKQKSIFCTLTAALITVGIVSHAHAQNVPATADPGRRIEEIKRKKQPAIESLSLPHTAHIVDSQAPEGAAEYQFTLQQVEITGINAYDEDGLKDIYANLIGQTISVADLYNMAAQITRRYRDDGYILAQAVVPTQEIDGGAVRIEVTEGSISHVDIEGASGSAPSYLQVIANDIQNTAPFNIYELERRLLTLNRSTGYQAAGILEPARDADAAPGAVGLKLVLSPLPTRFNVSVDNHGSKFVGPWQMGGSVNLPHRRWVGGISEFALYTMPQRKELLYLSAGDTVLINDSGLTLNLNARYSRSIPGDSLREIDLSSRYMSVSAELDYPLLLSRQRTLSLFGGLEFKNAESKTLGTRFYDDRLRIAHIGLNGYDNNILDGLLSGDLTFSQGMDILGARETGSIDLSRAQGRSDFSKIEAQLSHQFYPAMNWRMKNTVFGQYAFAPLLSSEEFGYGGYALGRGYNNSEITGDSGIGFSTELSYHRWAAYDGRIYAPGFSPFVFYDIGKVWNRDDGVNPESGASAGVGVIANWGRTAEARFTIAQPLTREIANPTNGNGKNPRFLFSLSANF